MNTSKAIPARSKQHAPVGRMRGPAPRRWGLGVALGDYPLITMNPDSDQRIRALAAQILDDLFSVGVDVLEEYETQGEVVAVIERLTFKHHISPRRLTKIKGGAYVPEGGCILRDYLKEHTE